VRSSPAFHGWPPHLSVKISSICPIITPSKFLKCGSIVDSSLNGEAFASSVPFPNHFCSTRPAYFRRRSVRVANSWFLKNENTIRCRISWYLYLWYLIESIESIENKCHDFYEYLNIILQMLSYKIVFQSYEGEYDRKMTWKKWWRGRGLCVVVVFCLPRWLNPFESSTSRTRPRIEPCWIHEISQ